MWSLLNCFRMEQEYCGACRRKLRLTDTDLCPIAARPRWWQNWIVAYPGYTLQMKKLFPGSPMVHDMHTRRRIGYCWTLIGNSTKGIQSPRVTPNLWSGPPFWNSGAFVILLRPLVRLSSVSCRTTDVVNAIQLSQLVDNTDHWTLFTAFDRRAWGTFRHIAMTCC